MYVKESGSSNDEVWISLLTILNPAEWTCIFMLKANMKFFLESNRATPCDSPGYQLPSVMLKEMMVPWLKQDTKYVL